MLGPEVCGRSVPPDVPCTAVPPQRVGRGREEGMGSELLHSMLDSLQLLLALGEEFGRHKCSEMFF